MKKYFSVTYCLAISALALGLLSGCGNSEVKQEEKQAKKTSKNDSVAVLVTAVENKRLTIAKAYTGTLEGEQQASIVSQLAERIVGIPVKVGSPVSAGQVVVRLDKGGVTSQYYQAQSNLKNIEKNLKRVQSLFESGAVARQQLDEIETAYDIAKANFNAARNAVEITSPISGVVTEIKLNPGEFTAPGVPIITVARISSLKLVMSVGEADIPYIKSAMPVKISSELNPSVVANGRITEIAKSADQQTRTFEVKASFSNVKQQWFKPGMFARAEVELSSPSSVNVLPREAVINTDEGAKVFVIKDGKAVSRRVKTGAQNEKEVEITEGVQTGEMVATAGMNNLKDGSTVVITTEDNQPKNVVSASGSKK